MKTNILLIIMCASLMSGCGILRWTRPNTTEYQITNETYMTIIGVQWILEKMTVDGEVFELTGEKPFIQIDDDKKVTGFASINRFFGSIEITDNGQVSWPSPLGSTQMAGPPELMKQEYAFLQALPKTERLRKSAMRLYAISKDGTTELVFYVPAE